jgi:hypothetical protein
MSVRWYVSNVTRLLDSVLHTDAIQVICGVDVRVYSTQGAQKHQYSHRLCVEAN